MKKVRDNMAGPPGGMWVWKCPETGLVIRHSNYRGIKNAVKSYFQANNFPIGSAWDDDFEQNICANAAPSVCEDFTPPTLLEKMGTLARTLAEVAMSGRKPVVTAEVLENRKKICSECNYFGGSRSALKIACRRCGCSGLALYLVEKHCPLTPPKWN